MTGGTYMSNISHHVIMVIERYERWPEPGLERGPTVAVARRSTTSRTVYHTWSVAEEK